MDIPPKDKFHFIYFTFLILMIATILPWKNLASGIDYFQYLYPSYKSEIVIPLVYNTTGLVSTFCTVITVHIFSFYQRIIFTTTVLFISLLSIPLLDIWIHSCTLNLGVAYSITVFMIILIAIALSVQQSSIFGLAGMLPPQYSQASALGMSVAGIIACLCRIITKVSFNEERFGGIAFFVLALLMVLVGIVCIVVLSYSKLVNYYMAKTKVFEPENKKTTTTDEFEMVLIASGSNNEEGSDDEEEFINELKTKNSITHKSKLQFQRLCSAVKKTWKVVTAIFTVTLVTLLIYPSLISEIQYCEIGDWVPVVLFTVFSVVDATGRFLTLLPYKLSPNWLLMSSFLCPIFIPLIIICISPSPTNPVLSDASFWFALPVTLAVGTANGFIATTGRIIGPTLVEPHSKELVGTISMFITYLARSIGSGLAYAVNPLTTLDTNTPCLENYTATFSCLVSQENATSYSEAYTS